MGGYEVVPAKLDPAGQRLQTISLDVNLAGSNVETAANSAKGGAGAQNVADALEVFRAGLKGVLGALADDLGLIGDAVRQASIDYQVADQTAMNAPPDVPSQPVKVPVKKGDSLSSIAKANGTDWMTIFNENKGKPQPDGGRLTDPDEIEPGWILTIPAKPKDPSPPPPGK
jgi:nucleoid-associated protein YgaU